MPSSRSSARSKRKERRPEPVVDSGPPVDPKERTIVWLLASAVVASVWILGGMRPVGLAAPAILVILAFTVALLPRSFFPEYQPIKRLRRFPIFWLGLAFLAWGSIHALNPSSRAEVDFERSLWFIHNLDAISWLPSGVEAPFSRMNGWRMLLIHGTAWLACCAAWIGLTRRRSSRTLLTLIVINGAVVALVCVAQRIAGNGKLLWFISLTSRPDFFGPITYRNHAGALLNIVLASSWSLAFWHAARSDRRSLRSSPAAMFGLIGGLTLVAVALSHSRGALIIAALTAILAVALLVGVRRKLSGFIPTVLFASLLALLGLLGAEKLGAGTTLERFSNLSARRIELTSGARARVASATWDMAQDRLWTGWGPGAFQYHFPKWESRLFWEYAHSDPVQLLAENGVIGFSLLLAGGAFWAYRLMRVRFWRSPWLLCLVGGGVLLFLHANFDFHLYNPAILITWCLLWPLGVQWREFEVSSARGAR